MTTETLQRWLKSRRTWAEQLKEAKKVAKDARDAQARAQREYDKLTDAIIGEVQDMDGKVYQDTMQLVRVVYSKPAVKITDDKLDLTKLDKRFVRQTPSLKKDEVRIALESGEDIGWAEMVKTPYLQVEGGD